jgi:hypothetical protein
MKIYLLLLSVLISAKAIAQPLPLDFSVLESPYAPLQNDTIISSGNWDDENWEVPLGFVFHYMGQSYDKIIFYGPLGGFGSEISFGDPTLTNTFDVLCPALIDVAETASSADSSTVSYITEGTEGNKIFKLQWNNCGVVGDEGGTMRVNYQVWLYQFNHSIDYRYGPSIDFDNGMVGFTVGLPMFLINNWNSDIPGSSNNCSGMWTMSGSTSSPVFNFHFSSDEVFSAVHMDDLPAANVVYHFEGEPNAVANTQLLELSVYPTIANHIVNVRGTCALQNLKIYDQMGKLVHSQTNAGSTCQITAESFAAGIYTVLADTAEGVQMGRFIKQ